MNGFAEALAFALTFNPHYLPPSEHHLNDLVVEYISRDEMRAQYGGGRFALYLRTGTIIRAEACRDEKPSNVIETVCKSTLAHELTHWLDHMYVGWPETCEKFKLAESHAYYVQMQVELREFRYIVSGSRMPRIDCNGQ